MESLQSANIIDLLTKFSSWVNILPFLDEFKEVKYIMQMLCKNTNAFWRDNSSILRLETKPQFRHSMTIDHFQSLKENSFGMYLINERYKNFVLSFYIASREILLEFIKLLKQVDDILDLQFFCVDFYHNFVESGGAELLIECLKERVPDISIPLTEHIDDQRLLRNKNSLFHILDGKVTCVEGNYYPKFSWSYFIKNKAHLKNVFDLTDNIKEDLIFNNNGCRWFQDFDIKNKVFISNWIKIITLTELNHPLDVKPTEILQKITEWKFDDKDKDGKFPLFEPEIFKVSYAKWDIEEIEQSLDLIRLKNQYNLQIDECKRNNEIK
jgi:hypothetical protein